ncbi:MAG: hypothetical protein ABSH04_05680 [Acidimicrobiales bacterium]
MPLFSSRQATPGTLAPPSSPAVRGVTNGPRFHDPGAVGNALGARVRPISARRDRLLPLLAPLAPLFPDGGLQRGTVIAVDVADGTHAASGTGPTGPGAGGATTLAFALLAAASATGSWCAAVGTADPGMLSMAELGVDLSRLALVPHPGPAWAEVTAALLDGMDAVLTLPPWPARLWVAHRLAARARERQAVLIVLSCRSWWPEGPEIRLVVRGGVWHGVGQGHGHLQGRRVKVVTTGRRVAVRPVSTDLWLPAPSGAVALA